MYLIMARITMIIHFLWIIFMIAGFALTANAIINVYLFKSKRTFWKKFLRGWNFFRTAHLAGICFVSLIALLGEYCPLTILEDYLRIDRYNLEREGFIIRCLEKIIYPQVNPLTVLIPTYFIAVFSIAAYIAVPPDKTLTLAKKLMGLRK